MATFGAWLKQVPPFRAALGITILLLTASFSLGAASVNLVGLPARTASLEAASLRAEQRANGHDEHLRSTLEKLERHIQQDSLATARIYCVVRLLADNDGPINPLACEPGGIE